MGKWYEIRRYVNSFMDMGDCVTFQYTSSPDNVTIRMTNEMVMLPNTTDIITINGTARLDSIVQPIEGRFTVNFNGNDSDYWVLNTDYTNYALVWSCANVGNNSMRKC